MSNCSNLKEHDYLFPISFIKPEPNEDPNLVARPLHVDDFKKGYCRVLQQLTDAKTTEEKFIRRFREYQLARDTYFVVVIEDLKRGELIGAASLVMEKKIIHDCCVVTFVFF